MVSRETFHPDGSKSEVSDSAVARMVSRETLNRRLATPVNLKMWKLTIKNAGRLEWLFVVILVGHDRRCRC